MSRQFFHSYQPKVLWEKNLLLRESSWTCSLQVRSTLELWSKRRSSTVDGLSFLKEVSLSTSEWWWSAAYKVSLDQSLNQSESLFQRILLQVRIDPRRNLSGRAFDQYISRTSVKKDPSHLLLKGWIRKMRFRIFEDKGKAQVRHFDEEHCRFLCWCNSELTSVSIRRIRFRANEWELTGKR